MKKIKLLSLITFCFFTWSAFGQSYPPNPDVIVATFAAGPLSSSTVANAPVVVSDPYNSRVVTGGIPSYDKVWATAGQIGAVYGIAYSPTQNKTYASAYVKRHTQLGAGVGGNPAGQGSAGAIYALDPPSSGGGPSTYTVLVDLGSTAGSTTRTTTSNWICDPVYYEVGTTGIGDIDVSPDGNFLWAMNMKNKSLYKISLPSGTILGSYAIPGVTGGPVFDAPVTNNENLDFRPCGIKVTEDKVYVGVVSSGESLYPVGGLSGPCNEPGGFPALRGYVFEFNIGLASFNATPVLDFPFAGMTWNDGTCNTYNNGDKWTYWLPANFTNYSLYESRLRKPIIADIEILNGDLLIGIRNIQKDKHSTITGLFYPDCSSGSAEDGGAGGFGGQTLRACKNGAIWTIENNGVCGAMSGYNAAYFYNHHVFHNGDHAGSIALKTGSGEFLLPSSPGAASGTIEFYSETTFNTVEKNSIYNLYAYPINTDNFLFGKANGLGDVDLVTELPITCMSVVTASPGNCNPANNQYNVTGQVTLTNPPSSGTVTVQIVGGGSQTFTLPQTSPISYSIAGQIADGASHTVDVTISGSSCASSVNYTAPSACAVSPCNGGSDVGPVCTTTAKLPDAPLGYQWRPNVANPSPATIDNFGNVTGMNASGTYSFLLSSSGTCGSLREEKIYPSYNASDFTSISFATLADANDSGFSSLYGTTQNVLWFDVNTRTNHFGTDQTKSFSSNVTYPMVVNYNPITNIITYTVGTTTTSFNPITSGFTKEDMSATMFYMEAKQANYVVKVDNIKLNGSLITNNSLIANAGSGGYAEKVLVMKGYDYYNGFSITADLTFTFTGTPTKGDLYFDYKFGKATSCNGDLGCIDEVIVQKNTCNTCSSTVSATSGSCNPTNNQYSVTGQVTLTNPPSSGTVTVQIVGGGSQTFTLPQTSPISYSIAGQIADGASHTVDVTISGVSCSSTINYTAPVSCIGSCQPDSLKICAGQTVEYVAPDGYTNYIWYKINGPGDTVQVATGQTFTTSNSGNYIYKAIDPNGCPIKLCCPVTVADTTCCEINNLNLVIGNCDNKGTLANASDDEYTFTLNPTGNGIGTTYTVSGLPNSPQTGTYGSPTTFGPYLISTGVLNITVVDNVSNTCSKTASVSPPPSCSVCNVAPPVLTVTDNICPSRTGTINLVQGCGAGTFIQYSINNGTSWSSIKPLYSTTPRTILARCVNSMDTTCKSLNTTVTTAPKKCPTDGSECSLIANATIDPCNNNGTDNISTDDYFTIQVSATVANGGSSNKYEVVIGADPLTGIGGNVLNSGGTNYGSPVTIGNTKIFLADGTSTYQLVIRDINNNNCFQIINIDPVASCSNAPPKSPCYPVPCVPIGLIKN